MELELNMEIPAMAPLDSPVAVVLAHIFLGFLSCKNYLLIDKENQFLEKNLVKIGLQWYLSANQSLSDVADFAAICVGI